MAVPVHSLASLRQFKDAASISISDYGKEAYACDLLGRASALLEGEAHQVLSYRGVPETDAGIVAAGSTMTEGVPLTLAGQPNAAGRSLYVQIDDPERALPDGATITIVGTGYGAAGGPMALQDVIVLDAAEGGVTWVSPNVYTAVASITPSALGAAATSTVAVGTRKPFTEFHSLEDNFHQVYTRYGRILFVRDFVEDVSRNYDTAVPLVLNQDYLLERRAGKIIRVSGSAPTWLIWGWRVQRLRYGAGVPVTATRSATPQDLVSCVIDLALLKWRASERKEQGVRARSDGAGSMTTYGPADISSAMRDALFANGYIRQTPSFTWSTEDDA